MSNKNFGIISPVLRSTDYIAGKETEIRYEINRDDAFWKDNLPSDETQYILNKFETGGCTNFSELNLLEIYLDRRIELGLIKPENLKKLKEWGYFDQNGKINFSDRALYYLSGTTQKGNKVENGWDAIRNKYALIPQSMWPNDVNSYEEFIKPVPREIQDFAKNTFYTVFECFYEWVVTGNCGKENNLEWLEFHLKQSPLQIIHPVCNKENNVFKTCPSCTCQHATVLYGIDREMKLLKDYDHYSPFKTNLDIQYPILWAMKGILVEKTAPYAPKLLPFDHLFKVDINYGFKSDEVLWLQKALNRLNYKIPETGYYGEITRSKVFDFQIKNKVDNIITLTYLNGKVVGPKTRAKLNELLK